MMTNPLKSLFASIALISIAACGQGGSDKPDAGEIRLNGTFKFDVDLVDHNGSATTDEDLEGKTLLVYYGFTTCPDVCPAALGKMQATLDRLGPQAQDVQTIFITVDPERDDPERLKNHLSYDPRILGLTGSVEQIQAAQDVMNVWSQKVPLPNSALEYTMNHLQLFYIIDAEGTPQIAVNDTVAPEQIARLVKKVL